MQIIFGFISLLAGYLIGSIPSGKIIGLQLKNVDIQKRGSKNIGFANACRVLGFKVGLLVLLSDVTKSFIIVYFAMQLTGSLIITCATGVMAVFGNIYPIWLKFKGGKGIATGFGVVMAISPVIALLGLVIYLLSFFTFRKSGVGSLMAALSLPLLAFYFKTELVLYYLGFSLLAIYTHRSNIKEMILTKAKKTRQC